MWNSHASLGVAIFVLYSPTLVASLILVPRHGRPRRAWIFLSLLSSIRVASGILVILQETESTKSVTLRTVAATLLGVGVYPLLFSLIGLLYLIQVLDFKDSRWFRCYITVARLTTLASILLLVGGTCLRLSVDANSVAFTLGADLAKTGAVLAMFVLFGCLGGQLCWRSGTALSETSSAILIGVLPAIALLAIRIAYSCLSTFKSEAGSKWNALNGSVGLFLGLALVPEYLCLVDLIYIGFVIPRVSTQHGEEDTGCKLTYG